MIETGHITRPKIDVDLVLRIKSKHPDKTAMLNNAATITWAINEFLKLEPIIKDGGPA